MKTILLGLYFCVVSVGLAKTAPAEGEKAEATISLTFVSPEKFRDLGQWDKERAMALRELGRNMRQIAATHLRGDVTLDLRVKDVDLAGDFEWWHGARAKDVRYFRDVYPPRMEVAFTLRDRGGRVLDQGETRLTNPNYLSETFMRQSDPLRYDKALFRDWVRQEFAGFRK
jgi:hypothetical protein